VCLAGDDPGPLGRGQGFEAVHGLLEERPVADQRQELLGPLDPTARPEPRPSAARHDHCVEHRASPPCIDGDKATISEASQKRSRPAQLKYVGPLIFVVAFTLPASSPASRANRGLISRGKATAPVASRGTATPALLNQSAARSVRALATVWGESTPEAFF